MPVRMPLQRLTPVRSLDLLERGGASNTEHSIRVARRLRSQGAQRGASSAARQSAARCQRRQAPCARQQHLSSRHLQREPMRCGAGRCGASLVRDATHGPVLLPSIRSSEQGAVALLACGAARLRRCCSQGCALVPLRSSAGWLHTPGRGRGAPTPALRCWPRAVVRWTRSWLELQRPRLTQQQRASAAARTRMQQARSRSMRWSWTATRRAWAQ